ncbi:helix-turn-helix domain-containing protein [Streptosporangium roseum]|uniref:helix-turn-helix domain-containing protein n=1 Tax=Streptosporangium roseum TaxID=2001 RepID=UPI003F4D6409
MDFKIREDRQQSQGRKALVREREEYFRLTDQGFNNTQACRIVGINRRTGKQWRHGRRATGRTPRPTDHSGTAAGQPQPQHTADPLIRKPSIRTTTHH